MPGEGEEGMKTKEQIQEETARDQIREATLEIEAALASKKKLEEKISGLEKKLFERKCTHLKLTLKDLIEAATWKFDEHIHPDKISFATKTKAIASAVSQVYQLWGSSISILDNCDAHMTACDGTVRIHVSMDDFPVLMQSMDFTFKSNDEIAGYAKRDIANDQKYLAMMQLAMDRMNERKQA
jgi:hypothetical protein